MFPNCLISRCGLVALICLTVPLAGCSQQEASDAIAEAEQAAEEAADTIVEDAGQVVESGKQLAGELGEKAMGFLTPLKEKFGSLEDLKGQPDQLKQAVSELLESIEQKAEGIELPESVNEALAAIKTKLVALKEYLEGEFEQANIDEQIQGIIESVKSGLDFSAES